ncbi:hypothetical protein ACFPM7_18365 [Actinokineospora guangxiensis]|uniref:Uncharacterized protein n=1 Tax=Actinokineospora guangxiensis TaxID=1490288 RepID=A0ABW0ESL4_9PSEU
MTGWDDPALAAATASLDDSADLPADFAGALTAARTVLAESRAEPEVRSLRVEVLAEHLVGHGARITGQAMDDVDAELFLLAGAVAVREAKVIAESAAGEAPGERAAEPTARMVHAYLRRAVGPLTHAAELIEADPVPHDLLQWVTAVLTPKERDRAWERAIRRAPRLYSAHRTRLDLLPAEQALAFARATARAAGSGDPRIALVAHAHFRLCARLAADYRAKGKTGDGAERHAAWEYFGRTASPIRTEIAALSQRFLAAARPHPRTPQAHRLFAAAFTAMSSPEQAEPHVAALGR